MASKSKGKPDKSTEERIMEAARKVFSNKGYAGTRTRDIAEEAGINLALVNYYYRSKDKLFYEVMQEKVYQLFGSIAPILINPAFSLETKIDIATETYIDMLIVNPDLPLLVFNEIKNHPNDFGTKIQLKPMLLESSFFNQIRERNSKVDPMQFLLSIIGLIVFPFIARPVISGVADISKADFTKLMMERKQLIPHWIKVMLDS